MLIDSRVIPAPRSCALLKVVHLGNLVIDNEALLPSNLPSLTNMMEVTGYVFIMVGAVYAANCYRSQSLGR